MGTLGAVAMLLGLTALIVGAGVTRRVQRTWGAYVASQAARRGAARVGVELALTTPAGQGAARLAQALDAARLAPAHQALRAGHLAQGAGIWVAALAATACTFTRDPIAGAIVSGLALLGLIIAQDARSTRGGRGVGLAWILLLSGAATIAYGGSMVTFQLDHVALPRVVRLGIFALMGAAFALRPGGWSATIAAALGLVHGGALEVTSAAALALGAQVGAPWSGATLIRKERGTHAQTALTAVLLQAVFTVAGGLVFAASFSWLAGTVSSGVGPITAVLALAWLLGFGAATALTPAVIETVEQRFEPLDCVGGTVLDTAHLALAGCGARIEEARLRIQSLARLILVEERPAEIRLQTMIDGIEFELAEITTIASRVLGNASEQDRVRLHRNMVQAQEMYDLVDELMHMKVLDRAKPPTLQPELAKNLRALRHATLELLGERDPLRLRGSRQSHETRAQILANGLEGAQHFGGLRLEDGRALGRSIQGLRAVAARAEALGGDRHGLAA
jgi:hypothetical protein